VPVVLLELVDPLLLGVPRLDLHVLRLRVLVRFDLLPKRLVVDKGASPLEVGCMQFPPSLPERIPETGHLGGAGHVRDLPLDHEAHTHMFPQ
jgi:hypothetical protein